MEPECNHGAPHYALTYAIAFSKWNLKEAVNSAASLKLILRHHVTQPTDSGNCGREFRARPKRLCATSLSAAV